jgi:predicted extracellular nuclease
MSEVQDNDGAINSNTTEADQTAQRLIDAILAIGGPQYAYTDVAPKDDSDGGESGGNIRIGFLYRTDTDLKLIEKPGGNATTAVEISLVNGSVELSASPARIEPQNSAFSASRKPLIAQFEWQGNKFFVIGMHMNSKGGDDPLFGENQPPYLESENQRIKQAQVIRDFLDDLFSMDPTALVVLGGDLNDFQFSAPLRILESENMKNLVFELPAEERYTYTYEGNAQALDHILVSNTLFESLSCFDIVHLNSEFSAQERFSDHDPVYSCFKISGQ